MKIAIDRHLDLNLDLSLHLKSKAARNAPVSDGLSGLKMG